VCRLAGARVGQAVVSRFFSLMSQLSPPWPEGADQIERTMIFGLSFGLFAAGVCVAFFADAQIGGPIAAGGLAAAYLF
jgi:hypothetical protein